MCQDPKAADARILAILDSLLESQTYRVDRIIEITEDQDVCVTFSSLLRAAVLKLNRAEVKFAGRLRTLAHKPEAVDERVAQHKTHLTAKATRSGPGPVT